MAQEEIAVSRSQRNYNGVINAIKPGLTVQYRPAWIGKAHVPWYEGKVVQVYEHIFRVKAKHTYECFTYADVMLGDVKVMKR